VVFDQLWWVLAVYFLTRYHKTLTIKYLYLFGIAVGLGLLTKYTMAFFAATLIASILLSPERRILLNASWLGALAVALFIFMPNLIWQITFHLPIIAQMHALKQQQLSLLSPVDFIAHLLVDNGIALLIWLPGLFFLFQSGRFRQFRFIGFSFVLIFLFYLVMNGKSYYLFGAYPMVFAAGGVAIEGWLRTKSQRYKAFTLLALALPNLIFLPVALPVLPLQQTEATLLTERRLLPFLNFVVEWEDHRLHPVPENYATMIGWNELTACVASTWYSLTPQQQAHTLIYADNYGEASAITYYGKPYNLPPVVSLSSSFALWAPKQLNGNYIIYVDELKGKNVRKIRPGLLAFEKTGEIQNPLAIEHGTSVYLLTHPDSSVTQRYHQKLLAKNLP
jgi:4-amino-4-deoxy-L-arabinose transferase-like glycosyltransferase